MTSAISLTLKVCSNFSKLLKKTEEWRLFIDANNGSLKAVLPHNENKYPSISIAHSATIKESCDSIAVFFALNTRCRLIFLMCKHSDQKVIGHLKDTGQCPVDMQTGFTDHCCFLCLRDRRAKKAHYSKRLAFSSHIQHILGEQNVSCKSHVSHKKILLPPLYIKLRIIAKSFMKALDKKVLLFIALSLCFRN